MEGLIERGQGRLGAGLAERRQVGVDDGRVQRLVPEILADLAQAHAFFEQVGGVAVAQAVRGGSGVDAAGGASQPIGHLHRAHAHGRGGVRHRLTERERPVGPAPAGRGKEEAGVTMGAPPLAQFLNQGGRQGHEAILAAFAVANVEPGRSFAAVQVGDFDENGLAHAQAAMIHEAQAGAEAGLAHGLEQGLHLGPGQDHGQDLRFGDADFPKHGPAGDLEALHVEAPQRILGRLHGAALVVLVLAQEQEVLAHLVLGEGGRITLDVLGQLAHVAHVFFLGRLAVIFEFDKLLEFCDGGVVRY